MTTDPAPARAEEVDQLHWELRVSKWVVWLLVGTTGGLLALLAYVAAHDGRFPPIPHAGRLVVAWARCPDTPAEVSQP